MEKRWASISVTKNLAKYTKEKAVNLSAMARATGIQYFVLYASFGYKNRNKPLSINESIVICKFIGVDLRDFVEDTVQYRGKKEYGI